MMRLHSTKKTPYLRGFSLAELVITVAIIGTLSTIAVGSYRKYLRSTYKTASKVELSDIKKSLNYMHSVDGGYHSRIYTAGYRPPANIRAWGGFPPNSGDIKCNLFPTSSNISSSHSRYFTLSEDAYSSTQPDGAEHSYAVCNRMNALSAGSCDPNVLGSYLIGSTINNFHTTAGTPGTTCASLAPSNRNDYKYDCNTYRYAIISKIPKRQFFLVTDQTGKVCAGEEDEGWAVEP